MREQSATLRQGTLILTITSIASQLLGFVYRIFLSRLVGAQVLGLYQLIMPVYAVLLSVTAVGLTAAVSHMSAQYQALGNVQAIGQLTRRCLRTFFLLLIPIALGAIIFSDAVSVYILGDARTRLGLVLLFPCIALTGVENLHKHYFYGTGNVRPPAAVEITEQIIRTAAVLLLLVLFLPQNPERTVGLIVAGMIICEVFSAAALLLLFRGRLGPRHARPGAGEPGRVMNRKIRAIAVPVGATALLGNLMASANSVLIPQLLVAGGMEVGAAMSSFGVLFGMTLPMLLLPAAFIAALRLVLSPKLAENAALHRSGEIRRLLNKALLIVSVLILPAMALMTVVGPDLGQLLFREPSVGAFIAPLAAGVALSCYEMVLASGLHGVGRQAAAARNSLICGAVQLAITCTTVGRPEWGMRGFVLGFVLSSVLGVLLNWTSLSRATGLKPQIFQWLVAPALSALLTGLCCRLVFALLGDAGVLPAVRLGACVLFGGLLYLSALQAQGVPFLGLFRLR
ncbi:Stage V sporulation protein B [bioreactor metagenome]|uniref:Stage V sporulation protein B n=1 Tax=bioreactor metagenome TaxID=1076179 RepID=A0A644Y316_9ZZZZ